jgi:hypothetical protein
MRQFPAQAGLHRVGREMLHVPLQLGEFLAELPSSAFGQVMFSVTMFQVIFMIPP